MLVSVPSAANVLPLRLQPAAAALVASVADSINVSPVNEPVNVTPEIVPPVATRLVMPVIVPPVISTLAALTEPVPLGASTRFPLVSSVEMVLPSKRILSTEADRVLIFSAVATPVPL